MEGRAPLLPSSISARFFTAIWTSCDNESDKLLPCKARYTYEIYFIDLNLFRACRNKDGSMRSPTLASSISLTWTKYPASLCSVSRTTFFLFSCPLSVCCQIKCLPPSLSPSPSRTVCLAALFVLAATSSSSPSYVIAVTM